MGIDTQENISVTRFMVLVCITLPMGIAMKVHGMKAASKVTECTNLKMVTQGVVNGPLVISILHCPHLLMSSFELFR